VTAAQSLVLAGWLSGTDPDTVTGILLVWIAATWIVVSLAVGSFGRRT
jgi:hypothetical protein